MIKMSYPRKRFILEVFSFIIVFAFLITSLVPSIGPYGPLPNAKPINNSFSGLASSNNNTSNACYVKYTLVLYNDTLINGNYLNKANGLSPKGISLDSSNGYLYVANVFSTMMLDS